jgi:hypothetical protein
MESSDAMDMRKPTTPGTRLPWMNVSRLLRRPGWYPQFYCGQEEGEDVQAFAYKKRDRKEVESRACVHLPSQRQRGVLDPFVCKEAGLS